MEKPSLEPHLDHLFFQSKKCGIIYGSKSFLLSCFILDIPTYLLNVAKI